MCRSLFINRISPTPIGLRSAISLYNADCAVNGEGQWRLGRRFDISPEQKTYGLSGPCGCPLFSCRPAKPTARSFEIWAGPKIYHRLPGSITTKPRSWISECSNRQPFLLNFSQLAARLHCSYGWSILAPRQLLKSCLAAAGQSQPLDAADVAPQSEDSRAARKIQRRSDAMNQEVMRLYKDYGINSAGHDPAILAIGLC